MIDIIYPYINSVWGGLELRYSLRSVEKYISGVRNVYIIGDKPDWINNVIHVPSKHNPNIHAKEKNICDKILLAFSLPDITDNIAVFNDDHYICRDIDLVSLPYYYDKELSLKHGVNLNSYRMSINNTVEYLMNKNLPFLNYDIHIPILYKKTEFQDIMKNADWRKPYGYVIKSLYCNSMNIEGVKHPDLKIAWQVPFHRLRKMLEGKDFFSIGDRSIGVPMKKILELYFPDKSKFEK